MCGYIDTSKTLEHDARFERDESGELIHEWTTEEQSVYLKQHRGN